MKPKQRPVFIHCTLDASKIEHQDEELITFEVEMEEDINLQAICRNAIVVDEAFGIKVDKAARELGQYRAFKILQQLDDLH